MKILLVRLYPSEPKLNFYNIQGIGLAKALVDSGNKCDIVFYTNKQDRTQEIEYKGKKITIYWLKGKNILKNAFFGNKIIELAKNYDIVQSNEYDQIYNLKLNKRIGDKLIIYHGPYYSKFNKGYNIKCKIFDIFFANKNYKKVKLITKSELAKKFLQEKGYTDVTAIGVGLDADKITDNAVPNTKLAILNKIKPENFNLLYIGKIEPRRNTLFLIDVLEALIKKNSNVRLVLVGKGKKEYIEKVFQYAKQKQLNDYIIYEESIKQEDISLLYKKCDMFLLPTSYDIFGMVLLEAMYFGLPVLTTLNGGSSTIIKDGQNGFVCNIDDKQKWAQVIEELIQNEDLSHRIALNAKNTITDEFLWSKLVENFINVYKQKTNEKHE